ncbi:hypothetical protein O181_056242 [Austropuccinia psidii MF-1]|uniref:CCHC-type domain-containing protein n=1 Tax=Austropuccinia psidii MF-1 TaxID=1389203 RepID=A0A9Q3EFB4_9BASI|nr:hypothetical protein [Austropuccinia psidii MF-1]
MNPSPDPPNKDNHMIVQEIYKSKPGFLTQSQYANQPSTLAIILKKLENLEKRETNVNLPANLEILIMRLNDRIDELAEKQSNMEKLINYLLAKIDNKRNQGPTKETVSPCLTNHPSQTTNPPSFAEITAGPRNMNKLSLPKRPPLAICQNQIQEINKFKKYHIIIRSKFGAPKPFEKISSQEACNTINKVLMEISPTCEHAPIRIRAFTQYPSRDIKLYTRSKMEACWLLENRASWTHKADPLFITSPPTFPIIVHSCPTYVDVDDEICRNALLQQNEIEKKHVNRIQWLGHPKEEDKAHGSLVIHFTERLLAQQILWGGLIFNGNFMRTMAYTPGPAQCFNCLKTGHQAFQCKENPTCSKCGRTHSPQD